MEIYEKILEESLKGSYSLKNLPKVKVLKPQRVWISKSKTSKQLIIDQGEKLIKTITPLITPEGILGHGLETIKLLIELSFQKPLKILIPETIVYGHGFEFPTFVYSDHKGFIKSSSTLLGNCFDSIYENFSACRLNNPIVTSPLALQKTPDGRNNKIYMHKNELLTDFQNISKDETLIQRYILPKGNICSKLRVIFRDSQVKIYKITNKHRFDKSNVSNLFTQATCAKKTSPEPTSDDSIGIQTELIKIFCTDSKNIKNSTISEQKSVKNSQKLAETFNTLKESINSIILINSNQKLSELICDFIEDYNKNIYFLQVKYYNCINYNHVPLKSLKNFKKFKCPGEYCSEKVSRSESIEGISKSFLLQSRNIVPNKCKVFRGAVFGQNNCESGTFQMLNPRLFERVRVCPDCFIAYNEKNSSKINYENMNNTNLCKKSDEIEVLVKNQFFGKIKINKNPEYMSQLGKKVSDISKKLIRQASGDFRSIRPQKKKSTVFFDQKKVIENILKLEEFSL
jgi:hypothetical protein